MKLGIVHSRLNPVLTEAVALLRARGVTVDTIDADTLAASPAATVQPAHDLYYLKTTAEPALGFAAALHAAGAAIVNAYPLVAALRDKAFAAHALAKAGAPVPQTWLARDFVDGSLDGSLDALLDAGPLVEKPRHGSRGHGVRVVRRREEVTPGDGHVLQRFHPSDDGRDHKLYVIGGRVFGVRRAWRVFPDWSAKAQASEAYAPEPALVDLALSCGRALGLDLYGLDVVVSGGAPFVVDVNKCAGFIGVPGAAAFLAAFLADAVRDRAGR